MDIRNIDPRDRKIIVASLVNFSNNGVEYIDDRVRAEELANLIEKGE